MTYAKDIIGILKELQESGSLKDFSPYCIGIVGKEEAEILDCQEGDEYALFHARHRHALCGWFGNEFSVETLAQALLDRDEKLKIAVEALEETQRQFKKIFGKESQEIYEALARISSLPTQ